MDFYGFDTETEVLDDPYATPRIVSLASYSPLYGHKLVAGSDIAIEMERLLDGPWTLAAHNMPFDVFTLSKNTPRLFAKFWNKMCKGELVCTFAGQAMVDVANGIARPRTKKKSSKDEEDGVEEDNESLTLDSLCRQYKLINLKKDPRVRLTYGELLGTGVKHWPKEYVQYAKEDAEAHYLLAKHLYDKHEDDLKDWSFISHSYFAIDLIHRKTGMPIDGDILENKIVTELQSAVNSTKKSLYRANLIRPNIVFGERDEVKSWTVNQHELAERVVTQYQRKGLEFFYTETGNISCSGFVCEASGLQVLRNYAKYVKASKLLNDRVPEFRAAVPRGALYSKHFPVASTARIKSYNINMQNLDATMRQCVKAKEGKLIFSADYSSAELHTLAQQQLRLFGKSNLLNLLNMGAKVHDQVAAVFMGENPQSWRPNNEERKNMRKVAKSTNFGRNGMMGPAKMRQDIVKKTGVVVPLGEVRRFYKLHDEFFPELPALFDVAKSLVGTKVVVPGTNWTRFITGAPKAANGFFQTLAGYGLRRAVIDLVEACYLTPGHVLRTARPLITIHDEINTEVDEEIADEQAKAITKIMLDGFNEYVPDCPVRASGALMHIWDKAAEPTFDGYGRLIAWDKDVR